MNRDKLTCRKFIEYLFPALADEKSLAWQCPPWPPDAFAVCIAILEKSGAYTILGTGRCCLVTLGEWSDVIERRDAILALADTWRERIENKLDDSQQQPVSNSITAQLLGSAPEMVEEWWQLFFAALDLPVNNIADHPKVVAALINIVATADEALAGVGIVHSSHESDSQKKGTPKFWRACSELLDPEQEMGSSLCGMICPSTMRTLPKAQTPNSGLSIRSLSHYLSLFPPVNVKTKWFEKGIKTGLIQSHCNMLLVPWPFKIKQSQFKPAQVDTKLIPQNSRAFNFEISDDPSDAAEVLTQISSLIERAESQVGEIHAVVLPETSVSANQFEVLREQLVCQKKIILIAGVLDNSHSRPRNLAKVSAPSELRPRETVDYVQAKHHRWKLDADQIERYGLTCRLDPEFTWWESFAISERSINFMHPTNWLTLCVLLCEDLAQFDPVGRAVRAVGPDLVVSLLMDGPQLIDRWPARYATVLADDPGCAVLTLTSLGMTELSRLKRATAAPVPRTIALWKDPVTGTVAIELPKESSAAILTIKSQEAIEYTADGRENGLELGAPVFGGVTFI